MKQVYFLLLIGLVSMASCGERQQVMIDGSSTVYPITEAVAEEFSKSHDSTHVIAGFSGTGGGFKKFCPGRTDITGASRPIKQEEIESCAKHGTKYMEITVAYDGLAVLVNPKNDFVDKLTVDQLEHIFRYKNPAKSWKEVDPSFPDQEIKVYAPGQDSGTYDYFVSTILGKKAKMRSKATFSEDDNILVTGIAGDKGAIGFFGLAYYEENKEKLKLVPIVNPKTKKPVKPSLETVKEGKYFPLSRPLFIYVSKQAKQKSHVVEFVNFYLDKAGELAKDVGYIPLPDNEYQKMREEFSSF